MTENVTGWLPVTKNMNHGVCGHLQYAQPALPVKILPTSHVALNPTKNSFWIQKYDHEGSPTLTEALTYYHVITPQHLFPWSLLQTITMPVELIEMHPHWQKVIGKHPTDWGMMNNTWCEVLDRFTHNGTLYKWPSHWWLVTFIAQLWNMAWNIWAYGYGIIHNTENKLQLEVLWSRVSQSFIKALPHYPQRMALVCQSFRSLLKHPSKYLQAWLLIITALHSYSPVDLEEKIVPWDTEIRVMGQIV